MIPGIEYSINASQFLHLTKMLIMLTCYSLSYGFPDESLWNVSLLPCRVYCPHHTYGALASFSFLHVHTQIPSISQESGTQAVFNYSCSVICTCSNSSTLWNGGVEIRQCLLPLYSGLMVCVNAPVFIESLLCTNH